MPWEMAIVAMPEAALCHRCASPAWWSACARSTAGQMRSAVLCDRCAASALENAIAGEVHLAVARPALS